MSGKSARGEPLHEPAARGPAMLPPGAADDTPWQRGAGDAAAGEAARPAAPPAGGGPTTAAGGRARSLVVLAGVVALLIVLAAGFRSVGIWPDFRNPFGEKQTDRSQPALLKSIQDLSRYVAAEGTFQKVVDLQTNRSNLPEWLINERTLFVASGGVEAYVDFSKIGEGAIKESADGRSVEIRLPAPQLGDVDLDLENSYVFAEQRGLLNRLGDLAGNDPNRQREVYRFAEEQIAVAARESGLTDRAQENTRKMLEGMLKSLGYQTVTITYASP